MADASPSSAKDLEIVEEAKEEEEEEDDQIEISNAEYNKLDDPIEDQPAESSESNGNDESRLQGGKESKNNTEKGSNSLPKSKWERSGSNTASLSEQAIRSRVFVGHLDTDQCSRVDVVKLFEECGPVKAVSLQHGYGFVQYEEIESALKALEDLHGRKFFGMNLVVDKPLMWKKLDGDEPVTTKYTGGGRSKPFRERPKQRMREEHYDWDGAPARYRDPDYERYLEMRYMEEMLAERHQSDRYYAPPRHHYRQPPPPDYGHEWHDMAPRSSYARPRDDPYDHMPFERERRHYSRYGY